MPCLQSAAFYPQGARRHKRMRPGTRALDRVGRASSGRAEVDGAPRRHSRPPAHRPRARCVTIIDDLADIAVFARVVDLGSFTAAAEALESSQPAVSRAVARLEERLGVRLLERTTISPRVPSATRPAGSPAPACPPERRSRGLQARAPLAGSTAPRDQRSDANSRRGRTRPSGSASPRPMKAPSAS